MKERLGQAEQEPLMPHDLINLPISAALKEFFGVAAVAVHDQTNPLSEITHKRRVSALGLGRPDARARRLRSARRARHALRPGVPDRDAGRPEHRPDQLAGPVRPVEYGFIEMLYRRVRDGKVTMEIDYLSAIEEGKYVIAQANATLDKEGRLTGDLVSARARRANRSWWAPSASSTWTCRPRRSCRWPPRWCPSWSTTTRTAR